jgi:hypothetical protein
MAYRYAAFADAIKSGRSESEALALARKSMFDSGDITKYEKPLQQLLLFYGFARNNLVDLAKNLADPGKGWKRLSQILKLERDIGQSFVSDEERQWAPESTETKIILDKVEFGKNKDVYITTPSIPLKDGIKLFGEILKGDVAGIFSGMLNPTYKELFNVQSDFNSVPTKVMPEHIEVLDLVTSIIPVSKEEILSAIVGSNIVPRKAAPEDGAVNGYIYPLTTAQQQARYKYFTDSLNYVGLSSMVRDYARTISGEGTPVEPLKLGDKLAYAIGAKTPSASLSPERQEYLNKLSKIKAIQEDAAKMKIAEKKEEAVIEESKPPGELKQKREAFEQKRLEKKVSEPLEKSGASLKAEYDSLVRQLREAEKKVFNAPDRESRARLKEEAKAIQAKLREFRRANPGIR